uniref:RRP15-like protein n=1 Tax=Macrostomum lignano TaxID=282301 RepID=A0A1I8GXP9_9PLAT
RHFDVDFTVLLSLSADFGLRRLQEDSSGEEDWKKRTLQTRATKKKQGTSSENLPDTEEEPATRWKQILSERARWQRDQDEPTGGFLSIGTQSDNTELQEPSVKKRKVGVTSSDGPSATQQAAIKIKNYGIRHQKPKATVLRRIPAAASAATEPSFTGC